VHRSAHPLMTIAAVGAVTLGEVGEAGLPSDADRQAAMDALTVDY